MINISNIHKSFGFNTLAIVSTFFGIIFCLQYVKNDTDNLSQGSIVKSLDIPIKIILKSDYDRGSNELNIVNLEYHKYPMNSVPVKVVLGKIKKIENPYLPKLHLAFLESE